MATKLLRETGNLKLVQRALNHADLKTTSRYAHVLDDDVADALNRLNKSQISHRVSPGRRANDMAEKEKMPDEPRSGGLGVASSNLAAPTIAS